MERLREKAVTAPRPLRIFYRAELGYQLWRSRPRPQPAGGGRARLGLPPDAQARVARRLVPVVAGLGLLGMVAGGAQSGGRELAVHQVDYVVPAIRGALPVGKGMWIWLADQAEGGNPEAIVARAKAAGLTHLFVRTASLGQGFYAGPFLDRLLPAAHVARIRVYAWDFPYLDNVDGDVARAVQAITYTTPDGHRVDGYAADVELRGMGVNITAQTGKHFGVALRRAVGPNYPLIACVPRPNPALTGFPYADLVAAFDAIAPMVYWLGADPMDRVAGALRDLSAYGKPILPVGQAYDGGDEGGPRGVPPREELIQFMQAGDRSGAAGVSWWSWQHADQEAWDAIRDAAEFRLPVGDPVAYTRGQVLAYQTLLTSLGFQSPIDGAWGDTTAGAVRLYQEAARLPATGVIDQTTLDVLLTPFAPPVQPQP